MAKTHAEYMREYRKSHPEYVAKRNERAKEYMKEYRQSEENREKIKKYMRDRYYRKKKEIEELKRFYEENKGGGEQCIPQQEKLNKQWLMDMN